MQSACQQVCPADAIKKTEDGVVQSALKPRCIACSNCVPACPFMHGTAHWFGTLKEAGILVKNVDGYTITLDTDGPLVAFGPSRLSFALAHDGAPVRDLAVAIEIHKGVITVPVAAVFALRIVWSRRSMRTGMMSASSSTGTSQWTCSRKP